MSDLVTRYTREHLDRNLGSGSDVECLLRRHGDAHWSDRLVASLGPTDLVAPLERMHPREAKARLDDYVVAEMGDAPMLPWVLHDLRQRTAPHVVEARLGLALGEGGGHLPALRLPGGGAGGAAAPGR